MESNEGLQHRFRSWALEIIGRFLTERLESTIANKNRLDITVIGEEHLKGLSAPVIYASNHLAGWTLPVLKIPIGIPSDVFIFLNVIARYRKGGQVSILAKSDINFLLAPVDLTSPLLHALYSVIPTIISVDTREDAQGFIPMVRSIKALFERGNSLLIFPEGGIQKYGFNPDSEYHDGVSFFAVNFGKKIIPICIVNARTHTPKNGPVLVVFGEPIDPAQIIAESGEGTSKKEIRRKLTEVLQRAINDLYTNYGIPFEKTLEK